MWDFIWGIIFFFINPIYIAYKESCKLIIIIIFLLKYSLYVMNNVEWFLDQGGFFAWIGFTLCTFFVMANLGLTVIKAFNTKQLVLQLNSATNYHSLRVHYIFYRNFQQLVWVILTIYYII